MASKKKILSLDIMPDEIIGSEIIKSGDFRHASVGVKVNDNEFFRISYEWKGDVVPEFVMALMNFMMAHKEEIEKSKEEHAEEYTALKERI